MLIKGVLHQEYMTILNLYAPRKISLKYIYICKYLSVYYKNI